MIIQCKWKKKNFVLSFNMYIVRGNEQKFFPGKYRKPCLGDKDNVNVLKFILPFICKLNKVRRIQRPVPVRNEKIFG